MKKNLFFYVVFFITFCLIMPVYNIYADDDYPCSKSYNTYPGFEVKKASYSVVCNYEAHFVDHGETLHIAAYNNINDEFVECHYTDDSSKSSGISHYSKGSNSSYRYYGVLWEQSGSIDFDYEVGKRSGQLTSYDKCPTIKFYKPKVDVQEEWVEEQPSSSKITPPSTPGTSYEGQEIKIIYIIGIALLIIRIVVPILLILMGMIGLLKAMMKNDDRDMRSELKKLVPKVIAAIIIFILPTFVALLMQLVNKNSLWNDYSKCLLTPTKCDIKLWEE